MVLEGLTSHDVSVGNAVQLQGGLAAQLTLADEKLPLFF